MSTATTSPCPECAAEIAIAPGAIAGEIVPCAECGAELEIACLDPLDLRLAPEVEEDWGE